MIQKKGDISEIKIENYLKILKNLGKIDICSIKMQKLEKDRKRKTFRMGEIKI